MGLKEIKIQLEDGGSISVREGKFSPLICDTDFGIDLVGGFLRVLWFTAHMLAM